MQHTVIIGNGISGTTCARWLRKLSDQQITIISSEAPHFFSRTALMYVYMGHMRWEDIKPYEDWFWDKNRINLIQDKVTQINFQVKELVLASNRTINYTNLVLAVGSKPNKFGWPGQELNAVGGLYHKQDLDNMEACSPKLERAVIVGGGLIGIEMAEMFLSRDIPVSMLVRESSYWNNVLPQEESEMISRHIREHHVDLKLGVNLQEIIDDGRGRAKGVIVKETGEKIACGYVGLTAGVSPNISFLKGSALETQKGILVNEFLETNIKDIYAIGDCAQLSNPQSGRRAIEAVWYTGRMMGETVAHNILGKATAYNPGIWFNSAKFFDIEYQVYGEVPNILPEDLESLYWEHPDGNKAIRINYDKITHAVRGFNLMGIRYRHEVCEKWIAEKTKIEQVLQNMSLANFDPEFAKTHEQSFIALFEKNTGQSITNTSKRSLSQVLKFLKS